MPDLSDNLSVRYVRRLRLLQELRLLRRCLLLFTTIAPANTHNRRHKDHDSCDDDAGDGAEAQATALILTHVAVGIAAFIATTRVIPWLCTTVVVVVSWIGFSVVVAPGVLPVPVACRVGDADAAVGYGPALAP